MSVRKPARIYLVRHGHSTANGKAILAGRDPKVELSDLGVEQAGALAGALASVEFSELFSSPLKRCLQTMEPVMAKFSKAQISQLPGVIEMDYGKWSGRKLALLSREKLWSSIQSTPSLVRFPEGESFHEMSARANESIRSIARPGKNILVCSHGDVIKAIIAGITGLHLDNLQRLTIDPASISIIELIGDSGRLIMMNEISHLSQKKRAKGSRQDRNLGGGSGGSRK
jgi:probable phosphomutase (TIGR03848 family)